MSPSLQILASVLLLAIIQHVAQSLPITRTTSRRSRPQSVSMYSPSASYAGVNPLLQSRALSNSRIASALYGGMGVGAAYPPLGGAGYSSYNAGYGGGITPYNNGFGFYQPAHQTSNYENYQTGHPLLGHATTSKRSNQYVTNHYGFPALGGSYDHSTNVYGGMAMTYPGVYQPIGAKYGKYGSYDPYGFGGHGSYQVTPHYTKVTHTQTIPNYPTVNKLAGYGK